MTSDTKMLRDDEDWESDLQDVFGPRNALGPRRVACPPPALLRGFHAQVLSPVLQQRVSDHVSRCVMCQSLGDAMEGATGDLTREEQARISSHIRARIEAAQRGPGIRSWWLLAAALVGLAVASALVWQTNSLPLSTDSASALRLEKPPVRLPDEPTDLLWRGRADSAPVDEFATALEPYRADDLGETEKRLAALVNRFPRDSYAQFYLGVTRLLIASRSGTANSFDRYAPAIAALQVARGLAGNDRELAQQTSWYLALAYTFAGDGRRAAELLDGLCRSDRTHAARACAGHRQLTEELDLPLTQPAPGK
jgi:hypothetical protein